jgi:hypothetical protein
VLAALAGLTPTDLTGIVLALTALLGLPATYWQVRRSNRRDIGASQQTVTEMQAQIIADLRREITAAQADCDERIDRVRREYHVRIQRSDRLLTAANDYTAMLERRILDMTVGGRTDDLLSELNEHSAKLAAAKRDLGLDDHLPG